jgi:hypothetical protein
MSERAQRVRPSAEAIQSVKKAYPTKSDAEKYRLAQAQTLIDLFGTKLSLRVVTSDTTHPTTRRG